MPRGEPASTGTPGGRWSVAAIVVASLALVPSFFGGDELYAHVAGSLAAPEGFADHSPPEETASLALILAGGGAALRLGAKTAALVGIVATIVARIACAAAPNAATFEIAAFMVCGGAGFALPALAAWGLSKVRRDRWGALTFPCWVLASLILASMPLLHGFFVDLLGWRGDFLVLAVPAALAAAALVFVRDAPTLADASTVVAVFGDETILPEGRAKTSRHDEPESTLAAVSTGLGLGLILIALEITRMGTTRDLADLHLLMALSLVAIIVVASTGLVADRFGPGLRVASALVLTILCGYYASTGGFIIGDLGNFVLPVVARIAVIAFAVGLLKASHSRVALAAAAIVAMLRLPAEMLHSLAAAIILSPVALVTNPVGVAAGLSGAAAILALVAVWRARAAQKSVASPLTSQSP